LSNSPAKTTFWSYYSHEETGHFAKKRYYAAMSVLTGSRIAAVSPVAPSEEVMQDGYEGLHTWFSSSIVAERLYRLRTQAGISNLLPAFPEYFGLPWLELARRNLGFDEMPLPEEVVAIAEKAHPHFMETFCSTAKSCRMWLSASTIVAEHGKVFNKNIIVNDKGEVVLETTKINLVQLEVLLGISGGTETDLAVIDSPFGRLGAVVCFDAFFDDCLAALSKQGVTTLVVPSLGLWPFGGPEDPAHGTRLQAEAWLDVTALPFSKVQSLERIINPFLAGPWFTLPTPCDAQSAITVRSSEPQPCPYVGQTKPANAKFHWCSPFVEGGADEISIGYIDL
jgi:hypothetical protein